MEKGYRNWQFMKNCLCGAKVKKKVIVKSDEWSEVYHCEECGIDFQVQAHIRIPIKSE